eukprot:scaffold100641_cov31-Tisochrysis_lutea.AAC.2
MTSTPTPPESPAVTKSIPRPPVSAEMAKMERTTKRAYSVMPIRSFPRSVCSTPSAQQPVRSRAALRETSCMTPDEARRIATSPAR